MCQMSLFSAFHLLWRYSHSSSWLSSSSPVTKISFISSTIQSMRSASRNPECESWYWKSRVTRRLSLHLVDENWSPIPLRPNTRSSTLQRTSSEVSRSAMQCLLKSSFRQKSSRRDDRSQELPSTETRRAKTIHRFQTKVERIRHTFWEWTTVKFLTTLTTNAGAKLDADVKTDEFTTLYFTVSDREYWH